VKFITLRFLEKGSLQNRPEADCATGADPDILLPEWKPPDVKGDARYAGAIVAGKSDLGMCFALVAASGKHLS
jgi:hypothetical protein